MVTKALPLPIAFRRHLAEQPEVWEAAQSSLRAYSLARSRRELALRLVGWTCLGILVLGSVLRFGDIGPVWLDTRLCAITLIAGWAWLELRRQADRKFPILLPVLTPQSLPEVATVFLQHCQENAFWLDATDSKRPIRLSAFEPQEAFLALAADPDIRVPALPLPRDMTDPDPVIEYPADAAPVPAHVDAPVAALTNVKDEAAVNVSATLDDGGDASYQRGVIKRAWTVYAANSEDFEMATATQFEAGLEGPSQRDFHALMAIHAAWKQKPWMQGPDDVTALAQLVFTQQQAVGRIPGHLTVPDRRSIDRLIWADRREFACIRQQLGMLPRPEALKRPSAQRRKQETSGGSGAKDEHIRA